MDAMRLRLAVLLAGVLAAGPASAFSVQVKTSLYGYPDTLVAASGLVDPAAASSTTYSDDGTFQNASAIACATGSAVDCTKYAPAGSTVVLKWTSGGNTTFAGWSNCSAVDQKGTPADVTDDECRVTGSRVVTANYKQTNYEVRAKTYPIPSASWDPPYGGTMAGAGIVNYQTGIGGAYAVGAAPNGVDVVFSATPEAGSRVKGWSGCTPAGANATTCTLRAYGPTAVAVTFEANPTGPQLVTAQVTGSGTVTSGTSGQADYMSCSSAGGDCSAFVAYDGTIAVNAVVASGSKLAGWTGCPPESTNTCTLANVTSAKAVTATFKTAFCNACHGLAPESHGIALQGRSCGDCHAGYTSSTVNDATHSDGTIDVDAALLGTVKHAVFSDASLATVNAGPQVSKSCVLCHKTQATDVLGSMHFTWAGRSDMTGKTDPTKPVGKKNFINNFCIATPSNEARCMQCHPSYSQPPVKDSVTGAAALNTGPMFQWASNPAADRSRIDCLICHANLAAPTGGTWQTNVGYARSPGNFGQPWPANQVGTTSGTGCFPACSAMQFCASTDASGNAWSDGKAYCRAPTQAEKDNALKNAAKGILARPARVNCGVCHFNSGGGDNVKLGDMGSALKAPASASIDVHMASTTTGSVTAPHLVSSMPAPKLCADCHAAPAHDLKGAGLMIPVDQEGRFECTECHIAQPHAAGSLNNTHAAWIACQTCHIPKFSRNGYTKVNWDWRTTGDKSACRGVPGCVSFGGATYPSGGAIAGIGGEAPSAAYTRVPTDHDYGIDYGSNDLKRGYDWKKGISTYAKNVLPTYRFFDGTGANSGTHLVTWDSDFTTPGTLAEPVVIAEPKGVDPATGKGLFGTKIYPFKKMIGTQPAMKDRSMMLVPHVFGDDGLWTSTNRGFPTVPNNLGSASNGWDPAEGGTIANVWTSVLNYGAAVAGQLGSPVAKAAVAGMRREVVDASTHLVTVNTVADLPATLPAKLYLIGAEAAFPTGAKAVTKTGTRQFTYTEPASNYTINAAANPPLPALPTLPANSTKPVSFFNELPGNAWEFVNTVMLTNINHEVAPKANALGCAACHPTWSGGVPEDSVLKELYNLSSAPGGCTDPTACRKRFGTP